MTKPRLTSADEQALALFLAGATIRQVCQRTRVSLQRAKELAGMLEGGK